MLAKHTRLITLGIIGVFLFVLIVCIDKSGTPVTICTKSRRA